MVGSIERRLTLELNSTGVQARLPSRQGEALVYRIVISFSWNGHQYFPKDAVWAEVRATLPDGRVISSDCIIEDGRRCVFIPGAEFFECGGAVLCRAILRGEDGGELCAPVFAIDAEPSNALSDGVTDAERYSRLGELISEVMAEKHSLGTRVDEKLAELTKAVEDELAGLGNIEKTKQSVDLRDFFPLYSTADGEFVRISWSALRQLVVSASDGNVTAKALVDNDTGCVAELPELEEDSVVALRSDIPTVPVQSVNGKTGAVSLGASDVGAAPASQTITITGVDEDGTTHTWTVYGVSV